MVTTGPQLVQYSVCVCVVWQVFKEACPWITEEAVVDAFAELDVDQKGRVRMVWYGMVSPGQEKAGTDLLLTYPFLLPSLPP